MIGPVVGGTHLAEGGRSVAPNREAPPVFTDVEEREQWRAARPGSGARPQVPVQPMPAQTAPDPSAARVSSPQASALPGQRTAGADQPSEHQQR
jgi:hypothetical protein